MKVVMKTKKTELLHLRIAEKGKIFCLEGNYKEALRHFGEALKMMQKEKGSELFFQHYTQCVMETLEKSGAYDDVISYCERYISFLDSKNNKTNNLYINRYYARIFEKQAIQYLLKEENITALQLFELAQHKVGKGKQPITDELIKWIQKGYQISKKQVEAIQKKYNYFIVRKDLVNTAIAMELPSEMSSI